MSDTNENRTARGHLHTEAFCLMRYQDEAGDVEAIWNSRDGVTPFGVTSRAGLPAKHIEWRRDVYAPHHVPNVGDRIFVTLTTERAVECATLRVEKWWAENANGILERYGTREEAIEDIARGMLEYGGGGSPDLVTVTPEMRERFATQPAPSPTDKRP